MHCCFIVGKNLKKLFIGTYFTTFLQKDRKRERQTTRKNPERERKIDTQREKERDRQRLRERQKGYVLKTNSIPKFKV